MKRVWIWIVTAALLFSAARVPAKAVALDIQAEGAVLIDGATGQMLYEHNAHQGLPLASVTKVMTMLLVMEALDSGRIGWDDPVTASDTAAGKGGSQIYLEPGEVMTVQVLLKAVAVASANDAACALAEHIAGSENAFVDMMNTRAKELGMENTHFVNCTGLDDDENAKSHLSSAYDVALMSRELLTKHPDIKKFTTIWMDTIRDGAFGLSNTNKMVRFYNGCTGLKTGYTAQAGFCLSASAMRDGMELIAVVLGCDSSAGRFAACKSMLDYGFATYALVTPELEETAEVPVKLGTAAAVRAVAVENTGVLIEKTQKNAVSIQAELTEELTAPVSKGQRLGTLTVRSGEQILAQIPLVAETAVERLSFGDLLFKILKAVCMK